MSGHQSAKMINDEWLTPPEILQKLYPFDLDPCSPIIRPWPTAREHYTKQDDGLNKPWRGRVWLNPPFGAEAAKWMERMADHGNGIALLAARTETRMFFKYIWDHPNATQVCFLRGRPHFHYVNGDKAKANSGAPICLIAYGFNNAGILRDCGLGKTVSV